MGDNDIAYVWLIGEKKKRGTIPATKQRWKKNRLWHVYVSVYLPGYYGAKRL